MNATANIDPLDDLRAAFASRPTAPKAEPDTFSRIQAIVPRTFAVTHGEAAGTWVICKTDENWRPIDTFEVVDGADEAALEELAAWVGAR